MFRSILLPSLRSTVSLLFSSASSFFYFLSLRISPEPPLLTPLCFSISIWLIALLSFMPDDEFRFFSLRIYSYSLMLRIRSYSAA